MSNSSSSVDASTGDYKFWRSQHKPTATAGEEREKKEVFYDAVCNRFGEELGQRLDRLIWPMVPERVKRLAGVMGGLGGPLALACDAFLSAKKSRAIRLTKNALSETMLGPILVNVDGTKSTLDWNDLGNLFDRLSSTTKSWTVSPLFSDSFAQFAVGEDASTGTYKHWGDGKSIMQQREVSTLQSLEYAKQFLLEAFALRIAEELGIDLKKPLREVDKDALARFIVLVSYTAKLFEMETSPK